jgi:hypothetical protein
MALLISGGCSFTWGSELGDEVFSHLEHTPSKRTWAALLAKTFNMEYRCVAKAGGGNSQITRRVIQEINKHKDEDIFVAIMWNYTHRSEIRLRNMHPYNTIVHDPLVAVRYDIDDYWINFNAAHGLSYDEKMSFFPNGFKEEQKRFFLEQHEKLTELGITSAAEQYYKITGDPISHHINTAKEIVLLQLLLESKNIPYFFCMSTEELYGRQPPEVSNSAIWQNISWNNWYRENGFVPWSEKNKYPVCGNHPGLEAHADWLNLILPTVHKCFFKNNA